MFEAPYAVAVSYHTMSFQKNKIQLFKAQNLIKNSILPEYYAEKPLDLMQDLNELTQKEGLKP